MYSVMNSLAYIVNLNYLENGWCTSWYYTPNKILSVVLLIIFVIINIIVIIIMKYNGSDK